MNDFKKNNQHFGTLHFSAMKYMLQHFILFKTENTLNFKLLRTLCTLKSVFTGGLPV